MIKQLSKELIYICHPYRGDKRGNIKKVRSICRRIVREDSNVIPVAPQLFLHQYIQNERQTQEACIELLLICSKLYLCSSKLSDYMTVELNTAKICNMPIVDYYMFLKKDKQLFKKE